MCFVGCSDERVGTLAGVEFAYTLGGRDALALAAGEADGEHTEWSSN